MNHLNVFILLVLLLSSIEQFVGAQQYIIKNATIIDIENGLHLKNKWVRIDGERISVIYNKPIDTNDTTIVIDGTGKYLIPGFWDMHTHLQYDYKEVAPMLIANGVVGVREMSGNMDIVNDLREQMNSKKLIAPEIISSGMMLDSDNPDMIIVRDSAEAAQAVMQQYSEGVDFIKVYNLNREEYFSIANKAKELQIDFAGHVSLNVSLYDAISAGQKSFEHNIGILEASCPDLHSFLVDFISRPYTGTELMIALNKFIVDYHDTTQFNILINELAKSDSWLCPTMVAMEGVSYQFDRDFLNTKYDKYFPQYLLVMRNIATDTNWVYSYKYRIEFEKKLMKMMIENDVKFLTGTDAFQLNSYPGFSIHDEIKMFNEVGFSTLQALQAATINPAIFLNKMDDYGTIEPFKIASFIILNSDPLKNIENTKDIHAVFLKGKYFSKAEINNLMRIND